VFYGGGKLAADLTLPKLLARWQPATPAAAAETGRQDADEVRHPDTGALSEDQRTGLWNQALGAAEQATVAIGAHGQDPAGATDAAWAASDFVASAAR